MISREGFNLWFPACWPSQNGSVNRWEKLGGNVTHLKKYGWRSSRFIHFIGFRKQTAHFDATMGKWRLDKPLSITLVCTIAAIFWAIESWEQDKRRLLYWPKKICRTETTVVRGRCRPRAKRDVRRARPPWTRRKTSSWSSSCTNDCKRPSTTTSACPGSTSCWSVSRPRIRCPVNILPHSLFSFVLFGLFLRTVGTHRKRRNKSKNWSWLIQRRTWRNWKASWRPSTGRAKFKRKTRHWPWRNLNWRNRQGGICKRSLILWSFEKQLLLFRHTWSDRSRMHDFWHRNAQQY